jgi:hypothetical protein
MSISAWQHCSHVTLHVTESHFANESLLSEMLSVLICALLLCGCWCQDEAGSCATSTPQKPRQRSFVFVTKTPAEYKKVFLD